jgi:hypothetical protein
MQTSTGRFPSSFFRRAALSFVLLIAPFLMNAQTPFAPTNVYNGWSTSTQAFATIPTATGLTFSQISRGPGLTAPTPVTSGITSSGWNGTASEAAATAANKFFLFSITANASTSFTVSSILFALQRSGTGPSDLQVTYSINGGPFAAFGSPFNNTSTSAFVQIVTPASAITVPVGGNVVFRLVGWNASNVAGTFRINNNTAISGTYTGVSATLSTTSVTGAPFCVSSTSGASATVDYSGTGGFAPGNIFSAELSDATGSFASPVTIGTLSGNALTGTINATIPVGTTIGSSYRIRVVASAPSTTGSDNGSDLSVIQGIGFSHAVSNITCNGAANGSITTTISEGNAPYTYAWSNSATTQNISGLSAGTYSLTITANNGCTGTISSATITEPALLTASAVAIDLLCNGGANGSVNLSVNGGTSPYTFAWSNSATTQNISSLAAGTYSVSITDNNGCTQTASATVTEPTQLTATATPVNVACNSGTNGAVNLTVNGGISPYTFAWSNSATTQNISGLAAGTYSVSITDNNGCTQTASATVTEPTLLTATATPVNVSCNGGTNGGVNLAVSGGTAPYVYFWITGGTTQNLTNVPAGVYSVFVTDINGCQQSASATVTEPAALSASTTTTDAACNGGVDGGVNLNVNGGTSPYTFAWSNSATTQNISSLAAGTYSVTITDNNGCTQTASAIVTEPTLIMASATATNVLCNGGTTGAVNLSVNGGTSPYTFAWSNSAITQNISALAAGNYSVTITDNNGCAQTASITITEPTIISASATSTGALCNGGTTGAVNLSVNGGTSPYTFAWSNSATTQNLSSLAAGTYSVSITDNNGCTQTASAIVTEPTLIAATTTSTNLLCNSNSTGAVNLSVNGGTAPYTFAWSNSATTQNISGLAAGTYSVIITDNNGCTQNVTGINITEPATISSAITATSASCAVCSDGNANLTVNGGTSPYTFAWSNSTTNEDLTGALPGTYTVVVTDNNGCQHTDTVTINFTTGIANSTAVAGTISVFPNPSNGENIRIMLTEAQATENIVFVVYDIAGNEVYSEKISAGNFTGTFSISLPLADGTYAFSVTQNNSTRFGKLMIVR